MIIVHRCTECRHPDIWAAQGTTAGSARAGVPTPIAVRRKHCGAGAAGAGHAQAGAVGISCHGNDRPCSWGPPEATMREWRSADNVEITEIRVPGQRFGGGTGRAQSCDCDACKHLYRDLTGVDLFAA